MVFSPIEFLWFFFPAASLLDAVTPVRGRNIPFIARVRAALAQHPAP